jgi:hypothetical protein
VRRSLASRSGRRSLVLAGVIALAAAAPAAGQPFGAGAPGLGDPYYPLAGNGGYDVTHYSLDLDYERASNRLVATAVIAATATESLSRFDLDLRGFEISRLTVNGHPAGVVRDGQELVVTPARGLSAGRSFVVRVEYAGQPTQVVDPDGSSEGWVLTPDGAFVANEPQGSPGWYPANDNPRDKATYDIGISVPEGITGIANGGPAGPVGCRSITPSIRRRSPRAPSTAWAWRRRSSTSSRRSTARIRSRAAAASSITRPRSATRWSRRRGSSTP